METGIFNQPARAQARSHIVAIVDEVMPGKGFFEAVSKRAAEEPIRCTVVCTRSERQQGWLVDEDVTADAARNRLRSTLGRLKEMDIPADGEIADPDPFFATKDAVRFHDPDEVLILARDDIHSGPLRRGLVERVRSELQLSVTHVVADPERDTENGDTLVIAVGQVDRKALVSSVGKWAGKGPARLTLIFTPGDGWLARETTSRDMEVALAELQPGWGEVFGQVVPGKALPALKAAVLGYPASRILIAAGEQMRADGSAGRLVRRAIRQIALPIELIEAGRGGHSGGGSASGDLQTSGSHTSG